LVWESGWRLQNTANTARKSDRSDGRSAEKVQNRGLPASHYDFLDSYLLDPVDRSARFAQMLRELPAGLSEWAVHPGLDTPELNAIEHEGRLFRQSDFDFLMSQAASDIVKEEAIILLDYRPLQIIWKGM
jgi:hypothetical protein